MNYAELVAASIAYSDRYDMEVSQNIPIFIIMTEARVNRLLKVRNQSAQAFTATVLDQEFYSLPPDWRGMRAMYLATPDPITSGFSSQHFNLVDPITLTNLRNSSADGPLSYAVMANQIQIYPAQSAGSSIEMIYYQMVPNLNATDDTNWLASDHPDIYMAGITAEISLFAKDYTAAEGWYGRLTNAVNELESVDWKERWSGDPLQVRLA